jgi:hypothetical protein
MSSLSDVAGGANLFGGANFSFVPDRRCSPNLAIYLNRGYLQVPEGVYFSGDFTFTAWIYLKSYQSNSRIFEFGNNRVQNGNEKSSDNVFLGMIGTTPRIKGDIFDGSSPSPSPIQTSSLLNLNKWYFISFVLNGTTGYIYVNGNEVINGTLHVPKNVRRTRNYIGKSNLATDSNADAIYDELKIHEGAFSSIDIMNEYILDSKYGVLNHCPSNYWPMSSLSDVAGGANLFGGANFSFVPDRRCSPNSAIYFNQGYLQVPEGVYFSGDFTFTAWIYLKSYQSNSRIFEFGNGQPNDNVALSMNGATPQLFVFTFIGTSISLFVASAIINLNEWYFVAFVLNGTTGYIYVNSDQVTTGTLYVPINIIRKNNYIGKSNWNEPNADAIYDELKIYQEAFSSADILNEYKKNSKNGNKLNR